MINQYETTDFIHRCDVLSFQDNDVSNGHFGLLYCQNQYFLDFRISLIFGCGWIDGINFLYPLLNLIIDLSAVSMDCVFYLSRANPDSDN